MQVPKKLVSWILFLVLLLAVVFIEYLLLRPKNSQAPVEAGHISALHIEYGKLKDEDGQTVQLTGMSSHGLLWYPGYVNSGAMQTLKEYGANTFRIAVYSDDEAGGYVQKPQETMQLLYLAVENAICMDMYAVVDWHVLQDASPLNNTDSALSFFEEVSAHYGDCPNLLYEICNEPNGGTTWDEICAYAEQVIPVIRKNAPNAVVIVGTPEFSYAAEWAIDRPLAFENVMYSFHFYAGQFDDHFNDVFNLAEKKDVALFVTEWGVNYGMNGKPALAQAEKLVTVLNRRKISWAAWSLSNKDEVYSAIRPDCGKLSGWEEDDLTDVGKLIFSSFRQETFLNQLKGS